MKIMQRGIIAILGLVIFGMAVIGTITSSFVEIDSEPVREVSIDKAPSDSSDSLRLIVVGDTGGLPVYPYFSYAQKRVAKAMEKLAESKKLQYVINVGDNIYFTGVENEYDPRFNTTFEEIYDKEGLNIPWYMIAGNHDHFGNVSAQIAYSKYSKKWNFPKLYYKLSFSLKNSSVDILMIDTIVLCGNTADIQNGGFFDMLWNRSHHPEGPTDPKKAEEQWKWINENLNSSKADYLFVAGHYPIYSISSHGPTHCLIERLDPLLKAYNVSAYFAGHDHNLQHIVYPNEHGHIVNYVVSGAGSRSDRSKPYINALAKENLKFYYPSNWNPLSQLGFSNGGFAYMEITKEKADLTFITGKSEEKYSLTISPRVHKRK